MLPIELPPSFYDLNECLKFTQDVNALYPEFFGALSAENHALTARETQFCGLTLLHCNSEEITKKLAISTRGLESMRSRLKKTFHIMKGDSILAHLQHLASPPPIKFPLYRRSDSHFALAW